MLFCICSTGCVAPYELINGRSCLFTAVGSDAVVGWNNSKTACENIGGHLVMIKTAEKQTDIEVNAICKYIEANTILLSARRWAHPALEKQVSYSPVFFNF